MSDLPAGGIRRRAVIAAVFLVLWLANPAWAADTRIEVIATKARLPQELVPVLQPLVTPGGTVTGMGNQLIVKGTDGQIRAVREVLRQIDRPPRTVLIEVRVGASESAGHRASGVGGKLEWSPAEGGGATSGRAEMRSRSIQPRREGDADQFIRALEGRPAFVAIGREVPIREFTTESYGGALVRRESLTYRPATTGFYVVPWVQGDQVTLQIAQHADRYQGPRQGFSTQQAQSSVSGRLGTWIPLAGSSRSAQGRETGLGYSASTRSADDTRIEVRVTALDGGPALR